MGLPKGRTNNPHGRPQNSRNKATKEMKSWIQRFLEDKWQDIQADFKKLEPRDRLKFYKELLEFVIPKERNQNVSLNIDADIEQMNEHEAQRELYEVLKSELQGMSIEEIQKKFLND
jgi:hypothetical protein